jgi:hypothetical protein
MQNDSSADAFKFYDKKEESDGTPPAKVYRKSRQRSPSFQSKRVSIDHADIRHKVSSIKEIMGQTRKSSKSRQPSQAEHSQTANQTPLQPVQVSSASDLIKIKDQN